MKDLFLKSGLLIIILTILPVFVFCQQRDNFWLFQYPDDDFTNEAMLDLRYLNEDSAGQHGFIRVSPDGQSFVHGNSKPVRFWPVNGGGLAKKFSDQQLDHFGRFLAKMGVNMIRFHGSINPPGKSTGIHEVDTAEVDAIWRLVAIMKRHGIYTTISPFWAHNGHMGGWVPEEWGIDGYSGKDALWGVMYFNDTLKNAYKTWVKYLYTQTNPYTGIPLKDEPAVALIQIKNEDGLFFWTMQNMKPELKSLISKKFSQWLTDKYGSLSNAFRAWNNLEIQGDDKKNGKVGLFNTWEMTLDLKNDSAKRMRDQVHFYTQTQYEFYEEIAHYYKYNLGCKQLINANNWKTADAEKLFDLERYTYTACDVMAVNRYYSPGHVGENSGWRINPGHFYTGESALYHPDKLPVNIKQVPGYPVFVTESGWNLPHKYQVEGPFLIAAYQSLTGVDGFYWFCPTAPDYDTFPYFEFAEYDDGQHAMNRWTCSLPGVMAMFPANALLYRLGYLDKGETVVHEERTFRELLSRESAIINEETGFDPNRDYIALGNNDNKQSKLSPHTFLTGPIEVVYGGRPDYTAVNENLGAFLSAGKSIIKSNTGEILLDYAKGICSVNSEKAKGICGFLDKDKEYSQEGVRIQSDNEYIAVNIVSMDEKPLTQSGKILLQTGTIYRPEGWKESPAEFELHDNQVSGYKVENTGSMPWVCQNTYATIIIDNPYINSAIQLDVAGYKKKKLKLKRKNNFLSLKLPQDALYVVLTK